MASTILLKSSATTAKVPTTSTLSLRELAINTTDGRLFFRQGTGVVGDSILEVATLTGTQTLSNKTASGLTLTGTLTAGGGVGSSGQFLQSTGTGVQWANASVSVSVSSSVTAGTNAQGQGALTSDYNIVTTTSSNPSGVTLPTATTGRKVLVVNRGTNPINVYPATGAAIDGLGANTSISIPVNGFLEFDASSTTQWYSTANSAITGTSSLTTTGTITSGTWSSSFGAVSGANLTNLTAGNLSGTIPSGVLGNSTLYVGTTAIALNRASASQALTGITSIDGNAATVTNGVYTGTNNALTGANTFTNSTGQIFRQAATQDGILLRGRAGGTTSLTVEIVPTTLTASRTITAPDASGTAVLHTSGNLSINPVGVNVTPTYTLDVNRGSTGIVARFSGSTQAGLIGATTSAAYFTSDTAGNNAFLADFTGNFCSIYANAVERVRVTSAGNMIPVATNSYTLGAVGNVWNNIYATTFTGNLANTLTLNTSGTGLSGSTTFNNSGAATFTVTSNATNLNTASTIVARDASGNFSAGTITATLSGSATNVSNSLTFNNGGAGAASGTTFNGSAAQTISYNTIGAPSTTGTGASGSWGISITGSSASCTGNSSTATTATNVVGIAGQVLYNSATNTTTTSANLAFDGTNLSVGGTVTASSDISLKKNIREIKGALDGVLSLRGVRFDRRKGGEKNQIGVIAQEVEKVYPELVKQTQDGLKSVAYQNMVAILIEAIKEQNELISSLSSRLDKLEFKE